MLIMRDAQTAALSEVSLLHFKERVAHYLATEYPTHADSLGSTGLTTLVDDGIASATRLGLRSEGAVAVWIELTLLFGQDLELSPERGWAHRILAHPTLPDHIKVDLVRERLTRLTAGRPLVRASISA